MKTALKILAAAMVAMFFASCSQQAIYHDGSGNAVNSSYVSSYDGGKEVAQESISAAPVVKVTKQGCRKCGSSFCAKPGCCGTVSKAVLARATAQGGSGEPHIGLIPTMKTLAP